MDRLSFHVALGSGLHAASLRLDGEAADGADQFGDRAGEWEGGTGAEAEALASTQDEHTGLAETAGAAGKTDLADVVISFDHANAVLVGVAGTAAGLGNAEALLFTLASDENVLKVNLIEAADASGVHSLHHGGWLSFQEAGNGFQILVKHPM